MNNKDNCEERMAVDNEKISEALKEISNFEYIAWDTACRLRALSKQK